MSFLLNAFAGGLLDLFGEELTESLKYSLPTILLGVVFGVALLIPVRNRPNKYLRWAIAGAAVGGIASVVRIGLVYNGYVSFLKDVNCFDSMNLSSFTYLLFAASGAVAGVLVGRLDSAKLAVPILGSAGITVGVLYHFQVASDAWTSVPGIAQLLALGEFLGPSTFGFALAAIGSRIDSKASPHWRQFMKSPHPLVICLFAAFICLTVRVGRTNLGGISGTAIVKPGTTDDAIAQTILVTRCAGIIWLGLASLSVKPAILWFKDKRHE